MTKQKYIKTKYSDCSIKIDDQTFHLHKNFISDKSEIFATCFLNDTFFELKNEINKEEFKNILDFCYGIEKIIYPKYMINILCFSHKYQFDDIEKYCITHLINNPKLTSIQTLDNLWYIFKNHNINNIIKYILNDNLLENLYSKIDNIQNKDLKNKFIFLSDVKRNKDLYFKNK